MHVSEEANDQQEELWGRRKRRGSQTNLAPSAEIYRRIKQYIHTLYINLTFESWQLCVVVVRLKRIATECATREFSSTLIFSAISTTLMSIFLYRESLVCFDPEDSFLLSMKTEVSTYCPGGSLRASPVFLKLLHLQRAQHLLRRPLPES